jgi:CubicO group peptidase (beta-lactamase class C family)
MKPAFSLRLRHGLLFLLVAVALTPVDAGDSAPPSSKAITAALKPFVDGESLAGAVTLVADKDKILSLDAVGYSDVAAKRPLVAQAMFWIASMSKPITAAALMLLVDDGKVNLDDPVEKYLPEFKGQLLVAEKGAKELRKPSHPITVREILSHTSGLPFSTPEERPTLDSLTLAEASKSYAKTPLLFEPGTNYLYSNAGINTAGRIIEVVSGVPFEEFLEKRLTGPLGMKDTTFWPSEEQLKRLAKPYRPGKDKSGLVETTISQLTYPLSDRKRQPMPAGGLFSTATDCVAFCQMLLNGGTHQGKRILSEAAVKELSRRQTAPEIKTSYGLGFSTGGGNFGHGGALATNMNIDTKRGLITVWLVQHAGFPGEGARSQGVFRSTAEQQFKK